MHETVKIAILSDLHCRLGQGKTPAEATTFLMSDLLKLPAHKNPIEALKIIVAENNLTADLLLCPGDITDRMDRQGLVTGWQHLVELKDLFNSEILAATVGNHDVDSRSPAPGDPFDAVKRLSTDFPTSNLAANNKFWADHFCIVSSANTDLLIFNSSYSHTNAANAHTSQISDAILSNIHSGLAQIKNNGKVKIAMCHHHPIKHSNISYADGDSIDKGDDLLRLLEQFDFKLIIHGHKHDPRITYYNSLPVFACGSFASVMNMVDLKSDNTFHFVEINKNDNNGTIKTWIYAPTSGWTQKLDTYFPCFTGFGARPQVSALASQCIAFINAKVELMFKYEDVLRQFPELNYLIPSEQLKLNELLSKANIAFIPSLPNRPRSVSKEYK